MAILRIDDEAIGGRTDLAALRRAGREAGAGKLVVMIHGYRYDPRRRRVCPHRSLYGEGPPRWGWPASLGLTRSGLGIGFGWAAGASLWRRGLWELSEAHQEAARAGARLADKLDALAQGAGRAPDVVAHSMGARVALAALAAGAPLGRAILLGPAAYAQDARAAYDHAVGAPEVYCLLSRRNALFDRAFEAMTARDGGAALGRSGLGRRRARWIDLDFDHPAMIDAAARLGAALTPAGRLPCHWSFYTRPGAMALHAALLARARGSAPHELRGDGAPEFRPAQRRRYLNNSEASAPAAIANSVAATP